MAVSVYVIFKDSKMMLIYELLRIAFGTQKYLSRSYSESEWKDCYSLSEKQGVFGICFSVIDKSLLSTKKCGRLLKVENQTKWVHRPRQVLCQY